MNYKNELHIAWKKNVKEVKQMIYENNISSDLEKKLNNFCSKHDIKYDELLSDIIQSKYMAYYFAKDPKKQNKLETIAGNYIKNIPNVRGFKKLPNGKGGIVAFENNIYTIEDAQANLEGYTKTIDFIWFYNSTLCIATHKYTEEHGGAQDNQRKDVEKFIEHTKNMNWVTFKGKSYRCVPFAILDGEYYQMKQKTTQVSHFEKLMANANNTKITTITNLSNILKHIN